MAFRKYEKTFRILTPNIKVPGKFSLTHGEQRDLLVGQLEITEKVDGANVGIIRGKGDKWILQKRRGLADEGVHAQFSFFWNWARHNLDKILNIPHNWIVYGELCFAKHNIYYDLLPSYFLVFDIWDRNKYLKHEEKEKLNFLGFKHVPLLHLGYCDNLLELEKLITKTSLAINSLMEGIVVKNYRKQVRGKLVRKEFMKELEEEDHWLHKAMTKNQLAPTANVYD